MGSRFLADIVALKSKGHRPEGSVQLETEWVCLRSCCASFSDPLNNAHPEFNVYLETTSSALEYLLVHGKYRTSIY